MREMSYVPVCSLAMYTSVYINVFIVLFYAPVFLLCSIILSLIFCLLVLRASGHHEAIIIERAHHLDWSSHQL